MEYLIGIVLGLSIAVLAKILGFDKDRSFYPVILIVIAMYYVLFAVISESSDTIIIELTIALLFAALAIIGARISAIVIAAGLMAHGLFDMFHNQLVMNAGVPLWWPGFCAGVDIVLGVFVLYSAMICSNKSFRPTTLPGQPPLEK